MIRQFGNTGLSRWTTRLLTVAVALVIAAPGSIVPAHVAASSQDASADAIGAVDAQPVTPESPGAATDEVGSEPAAAPPPARDLPDDAKIETGPSGTAVGTKVSPALATTSPGPRKVAVLLLNFSNDRRKPWTTAQARSRVFTGAASVNAFWRESSGGSVSLTGKVYGYYTIGRTSCDEDVIASRAEAAATAAGVDLASYTNVIYVFARRGCLWWAGLGTIGRFDPDFGDRIGRQVWINGYFTTSVVAHELGHNFGAYHANTLHCYNGSRRVALSAVADNCWSDEYTDPFSVMGSLGKRHPDNVALAEMGLLPEAQRLTVEQSGTYKLAAAELTTTALPRLIRLPRGDGTYLYLEFRRRYGKYFDLFPVGSAVTRGVSIRVAADLDHATDTALVDATPRTATYLDAALAKGKSITDPMSGIRITTSAVAYSTVTLTITVPVDTIAPSAPWELVAGPVAGPGIQLIWEPATDNRAVTGYRVQRDGSEVALLGPDATTWTDTGADLPDGLVVGTVHAYVVTALDAAGNESAPATASAAASSSPGLGDNIDRVPFSGGYGYWPIHIQISHILCDYGLECHLRVTLANAAGSVEVLYDGVADAPSPLVDYVATGLPYGAWLMHLVAYTVDPDTGLQTVIGDERYLFD